MNSQTRVSSVDVDEVRLNESDFYHDNPYPVLAKIRSETPVYWYEPGGFWVLTRYEDVKHVSNATETFSSESGVLLTDVLQSSDLLAKMYPDGVENFVTSDAPRHGELRRLLNFAFSRQRIQSFEGNIQSYIEACLDKVELGAPVDVVRELSIPVTVQVVMDFMELENVSLEKVELWSDDVFKMGSDLPEEEFAKITARVEEMFKYFAVLIEDRTKNPKDDFIGRLVDSELDGEKLTLMMIEMFSQSVLVAGNETTRNAFTSAIRLFAEYPDQYQRLLDKPELIDSAVEEILRFYNPTIGFMRMAKEDTEVGGTKIEKGQYVYMIYGAANRDPEVFSDPDEFDIGRFIKRFPMHLTFGSGGHVCIGMGLARLELRLLLKALIERFNRFELAGEWVRPNTLLGNGYVSLPALFKQ